MPIVAVDSPRFSAVVKSEYEPALGYCRDAVVINDTAQTIKIGTLLGKVTATGKYRVSLSASADGSQNPVAIYIGDSYGVSSDLILANAVDTNATVLSRGPAIVADAALILGTGLTASGVKTALQALNPPIMVEKAV